MKDPTSALLAVDRAADWLTGGGERSRLVRSMDWSKTPLELLESWPRSLKAMLGVVLGSRFPTLLRRGPLGVRGAQLCAEMSGPGGLPPIRVAVNISPPEPRRRNIAQKILDAVGDLTGDSDWGIDVEITEGVAAPRRIDFRRVRA